MKEDQARKKNAAMQHIPLDICTEDIIIGKINTK
jgi:hypothetical protein